MFLFPQIKQRPIQGLMGFGGGATGLSQSGGPSAGPAGHEASGGVITEYTEPTTDKIWRCHIFEQPGDFVVSSLSSDYPAGIEYLLVGGGGASGSRWHGGGGGAGGMLSTHPDVTPLSKCTGSAITVSAQTYKIEVGSGAASPGPGPDNQVGFAGQVSSIKSPTATLETVSGGGGGGASGAPAPQEDGGSGGGGGGGQTSNKGEGADYPGTDQQGFPGGAGGTRGGGAGGGGGGAGNNGASGGEGGGPTNGPYANGGMGIRCRIASGNYSGNGDSVIGCFGNPGGYNMFAGGGGGAQGDAGYHGYGGGWQPGPGWLSPYGPYSGGGGAGSANPVMPSKRPLQPTNSGESGYHNSGGGGGGAGGNGPSSEQGGSSGGSGICAIRYQIGSPTEGGTTDGATANATGGCISFYSDKTIHTFLTGGTFATTAIWSAATVEYVIIGGGGGGGSKRTGGGGGAGGYLTGTTPIGAHPISFALVVGCGGGNDHPGQPSPVAFPAGTLIAEGGGGGGDPASSSGSNGGSGGGARSNDPGTGGEGSCQAGPGNSAATTPQGNDGADGSAYSGGGGGGAGGAGGTPGLAGAGVQLPATFRNPQSATALGTVEVFPYDPADPNFSPGPGFWVAGGGGGGQTSDVADATGEGKAGGGRGGHQSSPYPNDYGGDPGWSGTDGTGGGGGGSYGDPTNPMAQRGGNGGAGIVLIAYPT